MAALTKTAKVYIAGELFDGIESIEPLKKFQLFIGDYLAKNSLLAPPPSVYLEPERFDRARLMLESGFDIVPADSEPFQMAITALSDSTQTAPPDEYIFAFASRIPDRFLDRLAGKGKRTLFVREPLPPGQRYDAIIDVHSCLGKPAPSAPAPAVPKQEPAEIIPLPPREPAVPKFVQQKTELDTASAAAPEPAAAAPEPAAESKPEPSPVPAPQPVKAPEPMKIIPMVKEPEPPIEAYRSSQTQASKTAAPKTPQVPRTDTLSLVPSRRVDGIQIGINTKECCAELLNNVEKGTQIPFSELAASFRSRIPGMENASDAVIRSLLPDDFRCYDNGGNLTVCREDRPELETIPAEIGVWLLQNDRLLNTELTEMVSSHADGMTLSDLADEVKSKYPVLKNVLNEDWLKSRLPDGLASYNPPNGPVTIMVEAPTPTKPVTLYPDFEVVSKRAGLMKDYCRWLTRKEKKSAKADAEKRETEFMQQSARLFVNLNAFNEETPREELSLFAECYEALEISSRLLNACLNGELIQAADMTVIGQMCANAICMLKSALIQFNLPLRIDGVQLDAFAELRKFTKQYHVFLKNMLMDDRIDPETRKELRDQAAELEKRLVRQDVSKRKSSVTKRIKYHFDKIKTELPGSTHDWNVIVESITELVKECGVAYTSDEIRGYLQNYIGKIPEEVELTDTFIKIVQYIEVAGDPEAVRKSTHQAVKDLKISNGVRKVRKAYKGTKLVFIGGTPQPHIEKRLKLYFQVESVIWEETCHGDSLDRFQSILNDDQVRLILVYIPWCAHKHSLEFSRQAKEAGKDFVRIRKGTNPETIAAAVCEQIGLK